MVLVISIVLNVHTKTVFDSRHSYARVIKNSKPHTLAEKPCVGYCGNFDQLSTFSDD